MSDDEPRRLRAELLRACEDLQHTQERLAYALGEVAELRKKISCTVTQAAAPGASPVERRQDPLERMFQAIRPPSR